MERVFCCNVRLLNFKFDGLDQAAINIKIDLIGANRPGVCASAQAEIIGVVATRDLS